MMAGSVCLEINGFRYCGTFSPTSTGDPQHALREDIRSKIQAFPPVAANRQVVVMYAPAVGRNTTLEFLPTGVAGLDIQVTGGLTTILSDPGAPFQNQGDCVSACRSFSSSDESVIRFGGWPLQGNTVLCRQSWLAGALSWDSALPAELPTVINLCIIAGLDSAFCVDP
jgi:hypothetical protein